MTKLFWISVAFCFCLCLPRIAYAKSADIMLVPTRIYFENNDRFQLVVVKNTGDATGDYTIDLVDMKMTEKGDVVSYDPGETPQYSAIPYLHIAPRSMTLKPGEFQNVRLMLRKPESLAPGEYRAHLRVSLVHDDTAPSPASAGARLITVKANIALSIPVIVRTGATTLSITIAQPKLTHDASGTPAVEMYLLHDGTRSSMGDISITCSSPGAKPRVVKTYFGVPVYRTTARRFISVPLDETPKDVNLSQCGLDVVYTAQRHDGGKRIAEAHVAP